MSTTQLGMRIQPQRRERGMLGLKKTQVRRKGRRGRRRERKNRN